MRGVTLPALSLLETRVLGVLVEKQRTVPDSYPLTLNALSAGCTQKSSRDPVLEATDAVEEDIPMAAFRAADDVFLTSTGRDVQAVDRIDHRPLPAPGPLTQAAAEAFRDLTAHNDDP